MCSLWKPILWIIGLQAVCLALGLWFHNQFVVTSAEWAGCDESIARLLPHADKTSHALTTLSERHRSDEDFGREAAVALRSLEQDPGTAVLLTDSQMRVIATSRPASSEFAPGTQIAFGKSPRSTKLSGAFSGALSRTGGTTAAVVAPLPNNRFALVYAPAELISTTPETLRGMLPLISGIAFVWIAGLQAAVIYLIVSRMRIDDHRREVRTSEVSQRRLTDLVRTRDAVVFGLAKLAESRDPETGQHLERIASFSVALCTALRSNPRFRDKITPAFTRNIGISSALHDIGKVGIEDGILLKPGKLTQEERLRMQTHTLIGGDCIQKIERRLAGSNFLQMAREIALYHHEHWD
ncbi:MAG: HD-GYP domain-containing protein, partial [Planctomycetaceae bacterium]